MARSLLLVAPHTLQWHDHPLNALQPHQILVKTLAGSISLGTELALYRGDSRSAYDSEYPMMTGYESYGEVVQIGEAVTRHGVGDRVFAPYGHRTQAVVHEDKAIAVPRDISPSIALLGILSCDVAKGIRKLNPMPEAEVLVTGGGAIGLLTVAMLLAYGVTSVDVVEPLADRREVAGLLGARATYSPDEPIPDHYSFGVECSSRQQAFALLQHSVQPRGKIAVIADGNIEALVLKPEFHHKELTVMGSSDGWDYHQHGRWFFDYVQRVNPPLDKLFTLTIPHTDLPATFATLAEEPHRAIKVLVEYPAE